MNKKKLVSAALMAALLGSGFWQTGETFAQKAPNIIQTAAVSKTIKDEQVASKVKIWMDKVSYVQSGGSYGKGEYKTFTFKNKTYRYLSKDIDTKKELLRYLTKSVTTDFAEKFIKERGIIQHKGRLAQVEADGGSLLQWKKATAVYIKTVKGQRIYKVVAPIGNTKERSVYQANMQYSIKTGWKINNLSFQKDVTLNIPHNVNPAFIFFHYLLVDSSVSEDQFSNKKSLNVNEFKNGITKVEVRTLKENGLQGDQAEYMVDFYVELQKDYKGSLNPGVNRLYFLIENTGEMEFKIISFGTGPHLYKNKK